MKTRLLLLVAIAAAAIGFPLAQTQVDTFETVRVRSQLGVRINPVSSLSVLHARGATATSGNYGLFVDDSATAPLLTVENDGKIQLTKTGGSVSNPSRYNSATQQPGFLAYTNADIVMGTGVTAPITVGIEAYDNASNFSGSVFTAPVTGQYLLCGMVNYTSAAAGTVTVHLVAAGQIIEIYHHTEATGSAVAEAGGNCVIVAMTATNTANLAFTTTQTAATVKGFVSYATIATYFSGRLMP